MSRHCSKKENLKIDKITAKRAKIGKICSATVRTDRLIQNNIQSVASW